MPFTKVSGSTNNLKIKNKIRVNKPNSLNQIEVAASRSEAGGVLFKK